MKYLKTLAAALALAGLVGITGLIVGCKHMDADEHGNMHAEKYTCAMHPEIAYNTPGKCPKCGMDLVQK